MDEAVNLFWAYLKRSDERMIATALVNKGHYTICALPVNTPRNLGTLETFRVSKTLRVFGGFLCPQGGQKPGRLEQQIEGIYDVGCDDIRAQDRP